MLALFAVAGLAIAMVAWRRIAVYPGLIVSVVFLCLGLFGESLWLWSRFAGGAGIPPDYESGGGLGSPATAAFLISGTGAALGGLLASVAKPEQLRLTGVGETLSAAKIVTLATPLSTAVLLLWVAGQGPSLLARDVYLATDGVPFLVRLTGFIGPVVGLGALAVAFFPGSRVGFWGIALGFSWWTLLTAVGTRLAVAFPIVFAIGLSTVLWRKRDALARATIAPVLLGGVLVGLWTFSVAYAARGHRHGISSLGALLQAPGVMIWDNPDTWIATAKQAIASVAAAHPITNESVLRAPEASYLAQNLNPLPAEWLGVDAGAAIERLFPWVPLSFVGEWFGATDVLGAFLLWFTYGLAAGIGIAYLARTGRPLFVMAALLFAVLVGIVSVQYSSRSAGRAISLSLLLPVAVAVLSKAIELIRPSSARQRARDPFRRRARHQSNYRRAKS